MPADPRTYITVHDGMPDHPKIEGLSDKAFRLLVTCWCWCSVNKTDGHIKESSWIKRGTPAARKELLNEGLAEVTETGVFMHDYLEHQRSADEIEELRVKRSEAGKRGGHAKANAMASAKQVPEQMPSKVVAESETDTEELRKNLSSRPRKLGSRIPDDWKPSTEDVAWQREASISDLLARRELPKFIDYWTAESGRNASKLDWSATWRNWLRRTVEREPRALTTVAGGKPPWEA